jgi:hypothetical protein
VCGFNKYTCHKVNNLKKSVLVTRKFIITRNDFFELNIQETKCYKNRHIRLLKDSAVPEFIDPVFEKTSPKRSFSLIENERFGLVFVNTGSINSGTVVF